MKGRQGALRLAIKLNLEFAQPSLTLWQRLRPHSAKGASHLDFREVIMVDPVGVSESIPFML
jgi:hypothetical protein